MEEPKGMRSGYFEGTLQLRNITKEINEFIDKEIKENKIYVASTFNYKNGVDMKISSNKFLIKLAKKLRAKFSGDLKISRRIYCTDRFTGKEVWRVTVLFSYYPVKAGQKVNIRGEEYIIKRLGDKVHCVSAETGKKKLFNYEEIKV